MDQWINVELLVAAGLRIVFILVLAWVVKRLIIMFLKRMRDRMLRRTHDTPELPSEASKRVETLVRLLRQALLILLWATVILMILKELGVQIAPLIASAGIIGLAVGFGAQNLVRDIISGFFFILENQIRVGDVATINGTAGQVEQLNFRTIVLRDLSGTVHVFPNGTVTTLSNLTNGWSAYMFDVGVAYHEDTDTVVETLREVGAAMKEDDEIGQAMLEDLEIFGVDQLADSAVVIKGRLKTQPLKQWDVGREFLRRVKKAFDEKGIEIPFPHQSLYFGEASKPIAVELLKKTSTD